MSNMKTKDIWKALRKVYSTLNKEINKLGLDGIHPDIRIDEEGCVDIEVYRHDSVLGLPDADPKHLTSLSPIDIDRAIRRCLKTLRSYANRL